MAAFIYWYVVMNNEKLGAAPQMYADGDTKQAIEFAWPYVVSSALQQKWWKLYGWLHDCCLDSLTNMS